MSNKNYNRGANFERKVKKYLESKKYLVFRSAGSHSVADLIAFPTTSTKMIDIQIFNTSNPWLIQCKTGSAKMSQKEIDDLYILSYDYGLNPILATINKKKRLEFFLLTQGRRLYEFSI
jgi:Holliday junction resolvase